MGKNRLESDFFSLLHTVIANTTRRDVNGSIRGSIFIRKLVSYKWVYFVALVAVFVMKCQVYLVLIGYASKETVVICVSEEGLEEKHFNKW